jgi:hypothetical protein
VVNDWAGRPENLFSILGRGRDAPELLLLLLLLHVGRKVRGKEPVGRPRRRWMNNIKMGVGEIGWGGVD